MGGGSVRIALAIYFALLILHQKADEKIAAAFEVAYYEFLHPGCAAMPYSGHTSGFLCPPITAQDGGDKRFDVNAWPPTMPGDTANACPSFGGANPAPAIVPSGQQSQFFCRFSDVMIMADQIAALKYYKCNPPPFGCSTTDTIRSPFCPLSITDGGHGAFVPCALNF